jgi:hypothetical protein
MAIRVVTLVILKVLSKRASAKELLENQSKLLQDRIEQHVSEVKVARINLI